MADEEKKEGTQAPGSGAGQQRSLEDLRAKLGLTTKPKAAEPEKPKVATAQDFSFSLNAPAAAPAAAPIEDNTDYEAVVGVKKSASKKTIVMLVVVGLIALLVGLLFGKVMRERATENLKMKEAAHLLEYFSTKKSASLGPDDPVNQKVIEAYVEDLLTTIQQLQKDDNPESKEKTLKEFLVRAREYRAKQPVFSVEEAFSGVVFNQEVGDEKLGFDTYKYIYGVQKLYDETVLLALEADTLDRVQDMEDRGSVKQTAFLEPMDKDGKKWMKGTWVARMDKDNPIETEKGTEYRLLLMGGDSVVQAPTTALAELDLVPVAKDKSVKYRNAIMARVEGRLSILKAVTEQVDFKMLREKLQKAVNRGELFTIF